MFSLPLLFIFQIENRLPVPLFDFEIFTNDIGNLLILCNFTFFLSLYGILINRKNFLLAMLFIELMYVSIFAYFIVASICLNSPIGQLYAILLLIIVACESAIGLGILIVLFYKKKTIKFDDYTELRG
jgi:NADH-quinone oxidoreductase subunit K